MTFLFEGLLIGFSLILAIGAQNAFVLRQGLLRQYVFPICLICALSDAVLIAAGIGGVGFLVARIPVLPDIMRYGGVAFLLYYGFGRLRAAWQPQLTSDDETQATSLARAVLICLAFTWLNPHVYLDTVVLIGSIASRHSQEGKILFGTGAVISSFVFFFSLGYGARLLQPIFRQPQAWRFLDLGIGMTMWLLAGNLLRESL